MSKTIGASLKTHIEGETTTVATCWKVTRKDGQVFAFTNHNQDLTIDGDVYEAASGFSPSAYQQTRGINVDNLEVSALLESAKVDEVDILGGLYDYATVDIFYVNYENLGHGKLYLAQGFILGELSLRDNMFRGEIRGKAQKLTQRIVDLYGAECRATLGDEHCKVNLDLFTVYGSITGVTSRQVFEDLGRSEILDRFAYGKMTVFPASYQEQINNTLTNASFETGDATGWTTVSGTPTFRTSSPDPQHGTYYVAGGSSDPDCVLRQEVDLISDGVLATIIDGGGAVFYFTAYQTTDAGLVEGFLKIRFKDTSRVEISTQTITQEDFATWTQRTCSAQIPEDTRYVDVELHMIKTGADCNCFFDNCEAFTRIFKIPITLTNPGFETGDLTGWTTETGSPAVEASSAKAPARSGSYQLGEGSGYSDDSISQEIDLAAVGFDTTAIDNGEYEVSLSWYQRSLAEDNDQAECRLKFKNASKVEISTTAAGYMSPINWTLRNLVAAVPANTRYIDVIIYQDYQTGTTNSSFFDDLSIFGYKADPGQGFSMEIKDYNVTTKEFTLFLPFPFELNVGDDYQATFGCDKRLATCLTTFVNIWNFRGEPFCPGYDKALQYP